MKKFPHYPPAIPNGEYPLAVVTHDVQPVPSGKRAPIGAVQVLRLELRVLEGELADRRIIDDFFAREDGQLLEDAGDRMKGLRAAAGVAQTGQVAELYDLPMLATVLEKQQEGTYPRSSVKRYQSTTTAIPRRGLTSMAAPPVNPVSEPKKTIPTLTLSEIKAITASSPAHAPAMVPPEEIDREILSWPDPPAAAAYMGLAGDIVRAIEPHSESDPVALLAQLLVGFGCVADRRAHYVVDGARHYANENIAIVGPTGSGRKGTSWGHVRGLFERAAVIWANTQILSGLSSGEGLIFTVRDPIAAGFDGQGGDPGALDKRVLIVETELSAALKVMMRKENTLSEYVRLAWDTGSFGTLTRKAPLRATNAHIALIGHITPTELRARVNEVEAANGLLNRFMLVAVKRSKYLPEGGMLNDGDAEALAKQLSETITFAQTVERMERNEEARALWRQSYKALSNRPGGLLGATTSRAAAHVVRLSIIYALLDRSTVIGAAHLEAALAFWQYVEASTRFLFNHVFGNPIADAILKALQSSPKGLTRSEINKDVGAGHWKAKEIEDALQKLANDGVIVMRSEKTGGRPREVWEMAEKKEEANKGASFSASSFFSASPKALNQEPRNPFGPDFLRPLS